MQSFIRPFALFSAALFFVCLAGVLALAADVKQEFEKLFGAEVKRVTATPDPADDVDFAQQLLTAAKGTTDQPEMRDYLCEYAFALGSRDPAGYPVAVEAMQFVAENNPAKKAECDAKILTVYQRGYERASGDKKLEVGQQYVTQLLAQADAKILAKDYAEGLNLLRRAKPVAVAVKSDDKDAIQARIDTYTQLAATAQKVDAAEKKLKANPWDKPSHAQLVELYLTDLDDPARASKHLDLGGDETQKKMVPLAVKSLSEIDEATALSLAEFYEGLSKKGITLTKVAMLTRSKGYYEQYLSLHTAEGVQKTAASLSMKRVTDALAKLESEAGGVKKPEVADGKTIDLLDYVDPARDGKGGRWYRVGDTIKAERGGFTDLPVLAPAVKLDGKSYNLKVKFVRDNGEGTVGVVFPVGDSQVSYVMASPFSGAAGLADVGGQDASRNATRKDVVINNGKAHAVEITVKAEDDGTAAVLVTFDGKAVVEWKGKQEDLSVNDRVKPGDVKQVAFSAYGSGVTIGSAKLKMLSGKADTLEKPVEKSVKAETAKNDKAKPPARDDERRDREKAIEDFVKDRINKGKGFPR